MDNSELVQQFKNTMRMVCDMFDRDITQHESLNEDECRIELLRREYLAEILHFHDWNQMDISELYDVLFRIREFKKRKEQ